MSCLSLFRLSARISQKPHVETSWNTPCMLPAAVARFSSEGVALRYVLPVSLMTSCLPIIDRATATQAGCDYVTHQGASPEQGRSLVSMTVVFRCCVHVWYVCRWFFYLLTTNLQPLLRQLVSLGASSSFSSSSASNSPPLFSSRAPALSLGGPRNRCSRSGASRML